MRFRLSIAFLGFVCVLLGSAWSGAIAQQAAPEQRGWLGAQLQDLSEETVKALGVGQPQAVLVVLPVSGGPAERAGLQPADVILELDGTAVTTAQAFIAVVQQLGPGKDARLGLWRRGERLTVAAHLGSLADAQRLMGSPEGQAANLERQIEAYGAILEAFPRERFPQLWATTQSILAAAYEDRIRGDRADNLEKAIAAYEAALTARTREALPLDWAQTQNNLGNAYWARVRGDQADNLERAVAAYEAALTVRTRSTLPAEWAATQIDLGNAYADRIRGDHAENLEIAIAAYEEALKFYTRDKHPRAWARTQSALAVVYNRRVRGNRAENLEKAIATNAAVLDVYTRKDFPANWARIQNNSGTTYAVRVLGDHVENLEKAIAAFEAALTVRTYATRPVEWATTQHNLGESYYNRVLGERSNNIEKAIAAYEAALTVRTRDAHPIEWAKTLRNLARAYKERPHNEWAENQEIGIAHLEAALAVFARESLRREWAATQNDLGNAYSHRIRGEVAENLEKALAANEAALTVYTREALPREWAMTQHNLGIIFTRRIRGDRADNLEKAIAGFESALTVRTREVSPHEWAMTNDGLAVAFGSRILGSQADNLEKAIAAHEATLTVYTRKELPAEWAMAQSNLGGAYLRRVYGQRSDNVEKSISAFEAALAVQTRETMPRQWSGMQHNLGTAYMGRPRGSQADNREKAIAALEAALTVRTRSAVPIDWAMTQTSLGQAYQERIAGEPADNLEKSIAAYESALTVYTREALPLKWASTRSELSNAYRSRILGDRANNREKAIAHARAALAVRTREAAPIEWALSQMMLSLAYAERVAGERADNLENAIAASESALTVLTREALPRLHLFASREVGRMRLAQRDWSRALTALNSAREAFLLLFGQGLDEAEVSAVVADAGPLFANAAYAAAQTGDAALALSLLGQGRARLMAVALRQHDLKLTDKQHTRHETLKAEIRQLSRTVDATTGSERFAALTRLTALRGELSELVKAGLADTTPDSVLAQLGSVLPAGGALVAPIVTDQGGKLLIATRGRGKPTLAIVDLPQLTGARVRQLMRGADARIGWLGAFALQNEKGRTGEWLAAVEGIGPELWQAVGGPLHAALAERGVRPGARLLWMPPGALGLLPIGLAKDGANGRPLGDLYEMVSVPSLEALTTAARQTATPAAKSLAVVINPTGDLPFTETEGALVAGHFPASARISLDKAAATPEAVLQALKGRSYWHFSSHGTFCWSDARQSGLIMASATDVETCGRVVHGVHGAPLTVGRLLEGEAVLGRPRLVVLSACETGIYDIDRNPDEFVGLPATFMQMGAAGVVSTLWQVDDMATALLISKFYDLHLRQGERPAAALKQAQAWLRGATRAELIAFARGAGGRGRLEPARLAELEGALTTRSRSGNARFALTWDLLWKGGSGSGTAAGAAATPEQRPQARPFAHPYYWGGFVYTGL